MFALWLTLACWCAAILAESSVYDLEIAETYFEEFIIKFHKNYATQNEKEFRFEIFKENLELINRLNEESDHAVFGISNFMDLAPEEIQAHKGHRSSNDNNNDIIACQMLYDKDISEKEDLPESFDWRGRKAVTRVKNQGQCGCCWAFSAIGHLEGQYAIKYGQLVELSEQELIDCDRISNGWCGGWISTGFKAAIKIGGVSLEKDYPYNGSKLQCKSNLTTPVVRVTDCFSYNLTSQEKVKQLLHKIGPIPISIRSKALNYYVSGILSDEKCSIGPIDHGVLLVGYGKEKDKPYWIVKNSWGPQAGEDGYFRMQRSDNPHGACGMLETTWMSTADIA